MKSLGDRRAQLRFEVLGTLRGTLELIEPARVINISEHGALIQSPAKMALGSIQELRMTVDGHPTLVAARVRHMRPAGPADHPQQQQYIVGLEFVSPPTALVESVAQLANN